MHRLFFLFLLLAMLMIPFFTEARNLGGLDTTAGAANINKTPSNINVISGKIIGQVLSFIGVLFFGLMLYAGILWMTAAGDEEKITKAKDTILAAIIGLIIVISAYAITNFVGQSIQGSNTATNSL